MVSGCFEACSDCCRSAIRALPRLLLTGCICLVLSACTVPSALPDYKILDIYAFRPGASLVGRVGLPPAPLLDALQLSDGRPDYRAYRPTSADMVQIGAALNELPDRQRRAMLARLAGIYFVSNLSSGGYSDYVYGHDGTLHTVLVLNPAILRVSMSQWIRDKELSAFRDDGSGVTIDVDCGDDDRSALLYILLHESGHLLDYVAGCTPYVEKPLAASGKPLKLVPFVAAAWRNYDRPLPVFDFSGRNRYRFYGAAPDAQRPLGELPQAYRHLALTPFQLLYASQNWAEDFAETVAFSEFKRITGRECRIRISQPGKPDFEFSLLDRPAVQARLPLLYSSCNSMQSGGDPAALR